MPCPKINAFIDRYNSTIQAEFLDFHKDLIHDHKLFPQKLTDYMVFYNIQRLHKSLGLKIPVEFLIENHLMSQISLTYTNSFL